MVRYDPEAELQKRRETWAHIVDADEEAQIEAMREWFYEHYEDPAQRTPHESREGGYIWIWGGPYDAREELHAEFEGIVRDDVIEELAGELEGYSVLWTSGKKPEDYDQEIVDDIADITSFHANFQLAIGDIYELLEVQVSGTAQRALYRLLYVNVITAMETYLSDAFISTVVPDAALMRRFVEINPPFRERKITLADVFKEMEKIEALAKSELRAIVWHNLKRIQPLYRGTLEIEFPEDLAALYKAIAVRHDLVHRNGTAKDGQEIEIAKEDIENLIEEVEQFVEHIDERLSKDDDESRPGLDHDGTIDLSGDF